ncbi:MAG: hypothetical protein JXL97_18375 [Bacteroidales bacterium]|nr:hypothetical protein [Bacteroidales bacterium]
MPHKIINTKEEYHIALARLEEVFMAKKGTSEYEKAEFLELLIKDYEERNFKFEAPNPIEAIKIRLAEKELKQADLVGIIGVKSMVSEVLNRKRKLNLEMIRKLHIFLDIPIGILVQDYPLQSNKVLA